MRVEQTQVITLPKVNVKFERNGLATLSSKAARLFTAEYINIYPSKDYSLVVIQNDEEGYGIPLSKENGYSRVRFNSAKLLKKIVASNPDIPRNFKSLKFEIKQEIIDGKKCIYFMTDKCFIA